MRYFKFNWNETRGDEYDHWGHSTWYLEIGEEDFPNRQIELYDNGTILKYSRENPVDEFGELGDQKFDLSEFGGVECAKLEFDDCWNQ